MSIWIRKKQARASAAQETKRRTKRSPRPALEALSLPDDVSGGGVRVILMGGRRALIENHLGVADVRRETICLATREGLLTVQGKSLRLTDAREGALAVEGRIEAVLFPPTGEEASGHD